MSDVTFFVDGNNVRVYDTANLSPTNKLPVGVYRIIEPPIGGMYLCKVDDFNPPAKIYGDSAKNAERIIRTFKSREKSTGVMLQGTKGSGKTLLAKVISSTLSKEGVPTILVDQAFDGPSFNSFMSKLGECVVIFDEFEKTFPNRTDADGNPESAQESLLTLFDGTIESKKLFILSVNNRYGVNEYFRNRPGRIFYTLTFGGLDRKFIQEYAEEKLINKEHIPSLVNIASIFGEFTFDMLQAIIEEMNRYGESAKQALKFLNFDVSDNLSSVALNVFIDGEEYTKGFFPKTMHCDPIMNGEDGERTFRIVGSKSCVLCSDDYDDIYFTFTKESFLGANAADGSTSYKWDHNGHEVKVIMTKDVAFSFNFDAF